MGQWFYANKEWILNLFSGIGVYIIAIVITATSYIYKFFIAKCDSVIAIRDVKV